MNRTILHSDCNCFYASVELLHHPELRGKPVAVGGDPEARHGIVLTADYTAKRYGVKTGMALWQAKQVCPDITFLPPRMDLYLRFSRMAQEIYADYTDKREPYGIDESWLDVTDSATLKGDGFHIAQEISSRMKKELGITVSVGVSFNKIFAKLGSDYRKPDAITTMYEDEFQRKAWCLPVSDLLYVGNATNKKLYSMGIRTIGDLAKSNETLLVRKLGKMGSILWAFANGYDESPVKLENTSAPVKSVGNSTTTPRDMETDEDVKIVLYILAESVAARLRENGFRCRTVEISVRDKELFHFSKQVKLQNASNITKEIAEAGYRLYKDNYRLPADDKELKSSRPEFFQKVAFHLAFAATVRIGELLGLTWDCVDISEEAISENRAYVFINKQVERVSKEAVEELDSKEVILIFPSQRKNNKTVRVLKTPKTDTSERKVYIPGFVAQCLIDIKKEQDEVKEALGSEYTDYNLIMAKTMKV